MDGHQLPYEILLVTPKIVKVHNSQICYQFCRMHRLLLFPILLQNEEPQLTMSRDLLTCNRCLNLLEGKHGYQ